MEKLTTSKQIKVIDGRLDGIDGRLDGIDVRLDGIDERLKENDKRWDENDKRWERNFKELGILTNLVLKMDQRFDIQDKKFDSMDKQFHALNVKLEVLDRKFVEALLPTQMTSEHQIKIVNHEGRIEKLENEMNAVVLTIKEQN